RALPAWAEGPGGHRGDRRRGPGRRPRGGPVHGHPAVRAHRRGRSPPLVRRAPRPGVPTPHRGRHRRPCPARGGPGGGGLVTAALVALLGAVGVHLLWSGTVGRRDVLLPRTAPRRGTRRLQVWLAQTGLGAHRGAVRDL